MNPVLGIDGSYLLSLLRNTVSVKHEFSGHPGMHFHSISRIVNAKKNNDLILAV